MLMPTKPPNVLCENYVPYSFVTPDNTTRQHVLVSVRFPQTRSVGAPCVRYAHNTGVSMFFFIDPDGDLALSMKQKDRFSKWARYVIGY